MFINMFGNYTDKAKRTIFYSRREAGEYGSSVIDTEHLLLALLREDEMLVKRFAPNPHSIRLIRARIEQHKAREKKIPGTVDIPAGEDYKSVLIYAADEAKQLGSEYIDTEHLLLGMLREEDCLAAKILTGIDLKHSSVRARLENEKK